MADAKAKTRIPIPFAKDSQEYRDEVRRRLRENWAKKKHVYRPAEPEQEEGDAPPLPQNLPINWAVPADLHDILGENISLTDDWAKLPLYHVRRQSDLSKTTLNQYKVYYYKLPQRDIWDVARFIKTHPLAQQNMYAKAALSYVAQDLWEDIYVHKRKGLAKSGAYRDKLQRLLIFSELSKRTKRATYEKHASQEASDDTLANTVKWEDWTELARRFVKALANKADATKRDKQEALAVAVYSFIPPVRLDWNDIEVRRTKGGKSLTAREGEAGKNILWLAPREATVFWGEFKNSSSFELPLKQELPRDLVGMLHKVLPEGDSTPLKVPSFSTFLTHLAEQITGKQFSNRLMRSSYIRWWHDTHSKGALNINMVTEMMKQLHQTNMQVHLGYVKHGTFSPNDIDDAPKTGKEIQNSGVDGANTETTGEV
jgi:hypothetical protein